LATRAKDFLGRGWRFPIKIGAAGGIMMSEAEDRIRESIRIILETAKGERVMRPDFGCDIHGLVFENINSRTINAVKESVRQALIMCEPRIEVLNVQVSTEPVGANPSEGYLAVTIDYRVRATNSEFNLVYPFYPQTRY
jgi:uncharacterized protein